MFVSIPDQLIPLGLFIILPCCIGYAMAAMNHYARDYLLRYRCGILGMCGVAALLIIAGLIVALRFPGPLPENWSDSPAKTLHFWFINPSLISSLLLPLWISLSLIGMKVSSSKIIGVSAALSWLLTIFLLVIIGFSAAGTGM